MQQLEAKFYSRTEIAEELSLNINDNKHFKRNVENKLVKWGYSFEYSRKGVLITRAPETANEKLAEILIREYDLDIQIDTYAFACFITAFEDAETFESMPWSERADVLKEGYGVTVSDRTLRNWASKLFKTGTLAKSNDKSHWKTTLVYPGKKVRQWIDDIEDEMQQMAEYYERRRQLVKQYLNDNVTSGKEDFNKVKSAAWTFANQTLWSEYGCCYYTCKTVKPGAFDETGCLQEIYELVRDIAADGEEAVFKVDVSITTGNKKEFNF